MEPIEDMEEEVQEHEEEALGRSEDDAVGNSCGVYRELAEGIGSLPRWCKEVRQKKIETRIEKLAGNTPPEKDHKTRRKNVGGCRINGTGDSRRSEGAATVHSYGDDFYRVYPRRMIKPRDTKDKGHSLTSHAKAYSPFYYHPSPHNKKLTRDEFRERSAKGLCWHCDEPWSREHRCKNGRLLMIEPVEDEDNEPSKEGLEAKEEAMEVESQPVDYGVHALVGYYIL
ncbi:hypothetical protein B296_00005676 [Ensete ventricosum]|uniref:Uncharacterized protein n=1 Tax=Ensete ventricosum TaxID=4639 RepID=A0A426ZA06_ENSVE|nr:hypothetical protein B296_00005676 [Ensete ventricosum]